MKYYELDNVIYRGPDMPHAPPTEIAVNGKWISTDRGGDARRFGSIMTEAEAQEFAGEDWPAEAEKAS